MRQTSRGHDKKVITSLSAPPGGASICHEADQCPGAPASGHCLSRLHKETGPSPELISLVISVVLLAVLSVIHRLKVIRPLLALPGLVEVEDEHLHLAHHHERVALAVVVGHLVDTHLQQEAGEAIAEPVDKW